MLKWFFVVGLGGAIGSILRYYVATLFLKSGYTGFPYATFIVNVTGCFLIGLLFSASQRHAWLNADWRLFLITGFCGGFTTFSTFAYENLLLLQAGNYKLFFLYAAGSYAAGLAAVWAGVSVFRLV